MKISVKAKPGAKEEKVEQLPPELWPAAGENPRFTVHVKEPPVQGRANVAIAKALAAHFKVPVFSVKLISGFSSKNKIFEITE